MSLRSALCSAVCILCSVSFGQAAYAQQGSADTPSTKMNLVWSDEFDGDLLNYSKWGVQENAFGGGNNELQIFTDRAKNVRVENGNLVLEAHRDNGNISGTVREYSSGRVRTKHRGDWKYGRIEVRAKMPIGQGIWPAIWMLPTDDTYGGWALSGEIDIMEYRGQNPKQVLGTLHYGGGWPNNKYSGAEYDLKSGSFNDDFHTFAIDWQEGKIVWSIDGKPWQTQTKWHSDNGKFPAPFDQRFHLLLNLSVGGHFVGVPNAKTTFPQKFLIDYVRVYK